MRWSEVRAAHPDQWLVIEALDAHSENDHRVFDRIAVIDTCPDGRTTMKRYGELRRQHPLVDTEAASTVINADIAADAGVYLEPSDLLRRHRGVGGHEHVFMRQVDRFRSRPRWVRCRDRRDGLWLRTRRYHRDGLPANRARDHRPRQAHDHVSAGLLRNRPNGTSCQDSEYEAFRAAGGPVETTY